MFRDFTVGLKSLEKNVTDTLKTKQIKKQSNLKITQEIHEIDCATWLTYEPCLYNHKNKNAKYQFL